RQEKGRYLGIKAERIGNERQCENGAGEQRSPVEGDEIGGIGVTEFQAPRETRHRQKESPPIDHAAEHLRRYERSEGKVGGKPFRVPRNAPGSRRGEEEDGKRQQQRREAPQGPR